MTVWFFVSLLLGSVVFCAGLWIIHHTWHPSHEVSRKIVHIAHAVVIVGLSIITNYHTIIILEVLFFVIILIARYWQLFPWMRQVGRLSAGEYLYPLSIITLAILAPANWIFITAILNLGLADGLAAVIGTTYGKGNSYHVFRHTKSLFGTGVFFVTVFLITCWAMAYGAPTATHISWVVLIYLPILTTVVENISLWGTDNITVPLVTYVVLIML